MRRLAQLVSGFALFGTILPALLFFAGRMPLDQVKFWMLVATLSWFVAAPMWMEHNKGE